ncbi:MAG: hypothetical protein ACREBD_25605 [Blastocatellia bacterium]
MSKGNVRPISADSRYSLEFQEFVIKHLALLLKMQTEMLQKMEEMNRQMVGMNQQMAKMNQEMGETRSRINYNHRRFVSVNNSGSGEVTAETIFHYHQEGDLVWATYRGGQIVFGTLIAQVDDNDCLDMRYQHLNSAGELMTGKCRSTPEVLPDGRLRLHEIWQWTSGDFSRGESVIEEAPD